MGVSKDYLEGWSDFVMSILFYFVFRETPFGRGDGKFWIDDIRCGGREYDIERCPRKDWGRHNCRSINQAGVICKLHRRDVISEPEPSRASGEVCVWYAQYEGSFNPRF